MRKLQYVVYAKVNSSNHITAVSSSAFLTDTTGWVEIDKGYGSRFGHAQGAYLPKSIYTPDGAYRYKRQNGEISECTDTELQEQKMVHSGEALTLSLAERIRTLEMDNAELKNTLKMYFSKVK